MIAYTIRYLKKAKKFFQSHKDKEAAYEEAIRRLMEDDHPESVDLKVIRGKHTTYYRIRLGNVRVIYTLINGKIIVVDTLLAGNRGDVYKKM